MKKNTIMTQFYILELIIILPMLLTISHLSQHSDASLIQPNADQTQLDEICRQSEDYDFCFKTLDADRRTPAADRYGLALLSIAINIDIIQATSDRIIEIIKTVSDSVDKQRIEVCQKDYADALGMFQAAYKSSSERSYWEALEHLREGTDKAIDCEAVYRRSSPIRESPTTGENHNVVKLAGITLIIINPFL